MADKKSKLEDDSNFIYYQELVGKAVGEKDWDKNTGFYVKMYKEYTILLGNHFPKSLKPLF
jgi:hypothetical protein